MHWLNKKHGRCFLLCATILSEQALRSTHYCATSLVSSSGHFESLVSGFGAGMSCAADRHAKSAAIRTFGIFQRLSLPSKLVRLSNQLSQLTTATILLEGTDRWADKRICCKKHQLCCICCSDLQAAQQRVSVQGPHLRPLVRQRDGNARYDMRAVLVAEPGGHRRCYIPCLLNAP